MYDSDKSFSNSPNRRNVPVLTQKVNPVSLLRSKSQQTPELCLAAVLFDGNALRYVHDQTLGLCMAALNTNLHAFRHVRVQSEAICRMALEEHAWSLHYIRIEYQTEEICMWALRCAAIQEMSLQGMLLLIDDVEMRARVAARHAVEAPIRTVHTAPIEPDEPYFDRLGKVIAKNWFIS